MRKDSPLVACIAAALVLLVAGALALPSGSWCVATSLLRVAPALVSTTVEQGQVTAAALRTGVRTVPALLQDRALEQSSPERPVRVCQGDSFGRCPQSECARIRALHRIPVIVPTSG